MVVCLSGLVRKEGNVTRKTTNTTIKLQFTFLHFTQGSPANNVFCDLTEHTKWIKDSWGCWTHVLSHWFRKKWKNELNIFCCYCCCLHKKLLLSVTHLVTDRWDLDLWLVTQVTWHWSYPLIGHSVVMIQALGCRCQRKGGLSPFSPLTKIVFCLLSHECGPQPMVHHIHRLVTRGGE